MGFDIFEYGWEGNNTVCGWGSKKENTVEVCKTIPKIVDIIRNRHYQKLNDIVTINDAGCGDLWWIRDLLPTIPSISYVGYDMFSKPSWHTLNIECNEINLCEQAMRTCDLIICRDVFIHWPNSYILKALELFKQSGKYLFSTSYIGNGYYFDNYNRIEDFSMHHSTLDLSAPPFNLGCVTDYCEENYNKNGIQKVMGLWRL